VLKEQRGVEIGPEPGDEEHHFRGDEQDHAVAVRYLHDAAVIAFKFGLADDVPPPVDHGVGDTDDSSAQDQWRIGRHVMHPQNGADGQNECRCRADRRPRAGIDQVVVVLRFGVCVGHRHLLHLGGPVLPSAPFACLYQICPDFSVLALSATGVTGSRTG
jgi:hypothetical protein